MSEKELPDIEQFFLIAQRLSVVSGDEPKYQLCCPKCGNWHEFECASFWKFDCTKCNKAAATCRPFDTKQGKIHAFKCPECGCLYRPFQDEKERNSMIEIESKTPLKK